MSLFGLLAATAQDPQLRRALAYAGQPGAGDADLVGPPALRPVLVAALAAGAGPTNAAAGDPASPSAAGADAGLDGRFVLAVTATARAAEGKASRFLTQACWNWRPWRPAAAFSSPSAWRRSSRRSRRVSSSCRSRPGLACARWRWHHATPRTWPIGSLPELRWRRDERW